MADAAKVRLPMTPQHRRWREFRRRLGGPEGCNFRETTQGDPATTTWDCDHTHKRTKAILKRMGLREGEIAASCEYMLENGGYCDCEIVLNMQSSPEPEVQYEADGQ